MLSIHELEQSLLALGFTRLAEPRRFCAGSLQLELLDTPRLRVEAPTGLYFFAASSANQLANFLADLNQGLLSPPLSR